MKIMMIGVVGVGCALLTAAAVMALKRGEVETGFAWLVAAGVLFGGWLIVRTMQGWR